MKTRGEFARNVQIQIAVRNARLDHRAFDPFVPAVDDDPIRRRAERGVPHLAVEISVLAIAHENFRLTRFAIVRARIHGRDPNFVRAEFADAAWPLV